MEIHDKQRSAFDDDDKEIKPSVPDSLLLGILARVSGTPKRVCKHWESLIHGLVFSSFEAEKKAVKQDLAAQKKICQTYMKKKPCVSKSIVTRKIINYPYGR